MKRAELLARIAEEILAIKKPHPLRVGIDGVDASGKTHLADELAMFLSGKREIIRASIDGFHNPKALRYRRGRSSPEGYYLDSFNYDSVIDALLFPLGRDGNLHYRTAVFDYRTNSEVRTPIQKARASSVLLMDGVFLFRPELKDYWDFKVFIDVPFTLTIPRAVQRDSRGDEGETRMQYETRYVPGQKLYFEEAHPKEQAHVVIDNSDFENPQLVVRHASVL